MLRSFIKNRKERKKVAFFWKEWMSNPVISSPFYYVLSSNSSSSSSSSYFIHRSSFCSISPSPSYWLFSFSFSLFIFPSSIPANSLTFSFFSAETSLELFRACSNWPQMCTADLFFNVEILYSVHPLSAGCRIQKTGWNILECY